MQCPKGSEFDSPPWLFTISFPNLLANQIALFYDNQSTQVQKRQQSVIARNDPVFSSNVLYRAVLVIVQDT